MTFVRLYTVLVTAGGIVGCLSFIIRYWVKTRGGWIRSEAGRFLMLTYMSLCALLILVLTGPLLGTSMVRTVVSLGLYTVFCVFAWWPSRLLNKADRMREAKVD